MKNKINIKIFCWVLSVSVSFSVCGQTYTLMQCRTMALENNIKMRTAKKNVEESEQDRKEAFTKYFPEVSAVGVGFAADKGLLEMDLLPGMSLSMMKNGLLGGVTAMQPVFAGGQIVNANKLARIGVEVSNLQQRQMQNEVCLTTEQYFWQIVTLKEKLNTLSSIEKMLGRMEKDVSVAVEAGISRRNDLLQIQLRQNDINSRRISLENALTLCKIVLAQYIGVAEDQFDVTSLVSVDAGLPGIPEEQQSYEEVLPNTVEYDLLDKNVQAGVVQKRLAIGKNLPSVAVGAGYMYDNLMNKDHPFGMVFASVSIPISGWWGGSHAIKKQSLKLKIAETEREDSREQLLIRMQKAWNDWNDAYKQMAVAYKSIEQSTENLRLNEDFYKAGTTKMSDLLDAQSMFQESRDKYIDAYAQYQLKKLEYRIATGRDPAIDM